MARIRTVKPDFWTDEKVGRLKREERLLFIGLWNLADDQGVIKSNPAYIKGQLFSYDDDLRISTMEEWLASLIKARMLVPFRFKAEDYLCIRTFDEHQIINRPSKEKFSKELLSGIKNTHGVFTEHSPPEGRGKEIEGKGEEWPSLKKSNLFRKPIIPKQEQVTQVFLSNGGNEEMSKKFFKKYESVGWYLQGSPITNFSNLVYSFIENWNKNLKNGNSATNSSHKPGTSEARIKKAREW